MYNKKGIFGLAIGLIILIGISRSIIQNNLEKTQSDITIEDAGGENSRTEEEISLAETDDLTGNCKWIYDHWTDFLEEKRIPCVDDAAFLVIQRAYDEIDFYGEFKKGNEEGYEEYRNYFITWISENKPLQDMSTGEDIYIKDTDHDYEQYIYFF